MENFGIKLEETACAELSLADVISTNSHYMKRMLQSDLRMYVKVAPIRFYKLIFNSYRGAGFLTKKKAFLGLFRKSFMAKMVKKGSLDIHDKSRCFINAINLYFSSSRFMLSPFTGGLGPHVNPGGQPVLSRPTE